MALMTTLKGLPRFLAVRPPIITMPFGGQPLQRLQVRWLPYTFAHALVSTFSGKGLVPQNISISPEFLTAVAIGAAITVMVATVTGFPISTTHSLTGALVGAGCVAIGSEVNFTVLGDSFFLPLLLSPVIAIGFGSVLYCIFRCIRTRSGITKEWCLCVGEQGKVIPTCKPAPALSVNMAAPLVLLLIQKKPAGRFIKDVFWG